MANQILPNVRFHHMGLKCSDIDKSLAMYKALGMTEVAAWGEGAGRVVMLDIGDGGRIELFANGSDEYSPQGRWIHFAMAVEDVQQAYSAALAVGFVSKSAPRVLQLAATPGLMEIQIAFVKGPDGEELEFFKQLK